MIKLSVIIRLLASIAFGLLHIFRYRYESTISDTENYHLFATYYLPYLQDHHTWNDLLGSSPNEFIQFLEANNITTQLRDSFGREAQLLVVRIGSIINLLSNNSFIAQGLVFSSLGFIGFFYIFKSFKIFFPTINNFIVYLPLLFMPSIVFWTCGFMKEPLCVLCIGYVLYHVIQITRLKSWNFKSILLSILLLFILAILKIFLFVIFILILILYVFLEKIYAYPLNRSTLIKISPIIILLVTSMMFALNSPILGKYSIGGIIQSSNSSYVTIKNSAKAGSSYAPCLNGESEKEILKSIPVAIGTSLFRPFIWEVNNSLSLLSSIESMIVFCLTIFTFFLLLKNNRMSFLIDLPLLLAVLSVTLIYLYFVAISSSNFGTLVRYKSIMMPFYLITLTITIARLIDSQKIKKIE